MLPPPPPPPPPFVSSHGSSIGLSSRTCISVRHHVISRVGPLPLASLEHQSIPLALKTSPVDEMESLPTGETQARPRSSLPHHANPPTFQPHNQVKQSAAIDSRLTYLGKKAGRPTTKRPAHSTPSSLPRACAPMLPFSLLSPPSLSLSEVSESRGGCTPLKARVRETRNSYWTRYRV